MSRVVFISHRHADEPIASVLNDHLQRWQLKRDEVFQSSRAEGGPSIGRSLNKELLGALCEARLVLLVYTIADADWSYCAWECGVATKDETAPTRVVVFRTTEDVPQILRDLISVRISVETDIKRFVHQFFKEKGWVREDAAFNPDVTDKVLDEYARELYSDLVKVAPKSGTEQRYRWDVFTLRFDPSTVQEVIRNGNVISEATVNLAQTRGKVVADFGQALKHFGYDSKMRDLTLSQLIQRWSEEVTIGAKSTPPRDWIKELCEELLRAISGRPAKPSWAVMLSHLYPDWWFYPIVNHQRIEGDGSMAFDVYMYRLPAALPATVNLPSDPDQADAIMSRNANAA